MLLYRIAQQNYVSDLSGMGAKTYGGRWNSVGTSMVYTSEHISLCALEVACNGGGLLGLRDFYTACLQINDKALILQPKETELPADWKSFPSPASTEIYGDNWIGNFRSLLLKVPSVVVNEEFNYLLNPLHPQFQKQVHIKWVKPFKFDPRLYPYK